MDVTVFDRLTPDMIRHDPFPHIVVDDALDHRLFRELIACRPATPFANDRAPNRRAPISARMIRLLDHYPEPWKRFVTRHVQPDVARRVFELFRDVWPSHLPALDDPGLRFGVREEESHADCDILCDARLEIVTPAWRPGTHRRGHLDMPNRLFSALWYLRPPEDDSTGGGLEIFRWRGERAASLAANELPAEMLELVETIPYRGNRLVVFPNSPDALHGSEMRGATRHDRAFAFITAEVERPLF